MKMTTLRGLAVLALLVLAPCVRAVSMETATGQRSFEDVGLTNRFEILIPMFRFDLAPADVDAVTMNIVLDAAVTVTPRNTALNVERYVPIGVHMAGIVYFNGLAPYEGRGLGDISASAGSALLGPLQTGSETALLLHMERTLHFTREQFPYYFGSFGFWERPSLFAYITAYEGNSRGVLQGTVTVHYHVTDTLPGIVGFLAVAFMACIHHALRQN